jgi:hypothetical protein
MPRPVTRPQIWTALRDAGLVPADLTPTRDIGRWVDGDLWHAVGVRKVGDQLDWGVWVGVAAFLQSLDEYGRMGVDVRIGDGWEPWPLNAGDVHELLDQRYAPALAAVISPHDILDALEAGILDRNGIRIGRRAASRPGNVVSAVILAEHLGEPERAEANRQAARQLKGVPFPAPGMTADQWDMAKGWARDLGRAMGRPVRL